MKIYYNTSGKIIYTVWNKDQNSFSHTTNAPLGTIEIDEAQNKDLCIDLALYGPETKDFKDVNGNYKYYVENGELFQTDNWQLHLKGY